MATSARFAVVVATVMVAWTQGAAAGPYDGWKPHGYCNDLDTMDTTKIAPLTAEQAARVESLEQVQIIARHGARAPYYRLFCWDEKKHNPMNAEWNCTTTSVSNQDIGFNPTTGFGRLYRKQYLEGQNILNGNCIVGGLLPLGRQQHLKNGLILRDAYIGDGALKLFPHANLSQLALDQIYLRSDDQERTLGSGQALMDGMFPVDGSLSRSVDHMLTWNVADYSTDHINANDKICPLMGYIGNLSTNSAEFQKHVKEPDQVVLAKNFEGHVGNFSWDSALECLSTARCNDLPLPDGIDEDTFTKVFQEVEARQVLYLTYNNSWYAKTAMQPLVNEILGRLNLALEGSPKAQRLAITMGHDSTIMPFMAAIVKENWDGKWTPYAGVLSMELYKLKTGSFAARMIFQGQPVLIPECNDTLCDIKDYLKALEFGHTDRNCDSPVTADSSVLISDSQSASGFSFSQYASASVLLGLVALCAFLGIRSQREKKSRGSGRWGDENDNLLG
uniref:Histidine acid phosphatase n=1 Tax=Globisporangium ultimum (strain ATCC 200006 / CBS 805.95 / DAOM BR144) TaxID=431595 RepID=K3XBI8_GLOUD